MTDAEIIERAWRASDMTQEAFARDVLGVTRSGLTGWLRGAPAPGPVVTLCAILLHRPQLTAEAPRWREGLRNRAAPLSVIK